MRLILSFVLLLSATLLSCAVSRQGDDYQMTGVVDLSLTESNHRHGYGYSDCFACHLPQNIHTVDRIHAPSFSLATPLVQSQGLNSCSGCHGQNGVKP